MSRIIEEIAGWVNEVSFSDIPKRVVEKGKYQILSLISSLYSGINSRAGNIILKTIRQQKIKGNCRIIPSGDKTSLQNAILVNSSFGLAYDFDDYIFMGHPSHSAVIVPLAMAEELHLGGKEILLAQVIANEVAGRLGASCLIGPHNGQTWSFIHSISSVCASAKLMKLSREQTENAIAISLYQPNYVLFPGFMGPDTKLLTAGISAQSGIFSAQLAQNGFTGSKDIIEHPQGFLRHFSFVPFENMLSGFGKVWVLDTIGYKMYPGCAYIQSTIDALLEIMRNFEKSEGRKLEPSDIKKIIVKATILTVGMDGLTRDNIASSKISSVVVNFSIPLSAALTIIAGKLTSKELTDDFLTKHKKEILDLSKKVELSHSPSMTLNLINELGKTGVLEVLLGNINIREIIELRKNLQKGAGSQIHLDFKDFLHLFKLSSKERKVIKSLIKMITKKKIYNKNASITLEAVDFKNLKMPFSAKVKLITSEGLILESVKKVQSGASGSGKNKEIFRCVINKFRQEAEEYIGKTKVEKVIEMTDNFENIKDIGKFINEICYSDSK